MGKKTLTDRTEEVSPVSEEIKPNVPTGEKGADDVQNTQETALPGKTLQGLDPDTIKRISEARSNYGIDSDAIKRISEVARTSNPFGTFSNYLGSIPFHSTSIISSPIHKDILELRSQLNVLEKQKSETIEKYNDLLQEKETDAHNRADREKELKQINDQLFSQQLELEKKAQLNDLLSSVEEKARVKLLKDEGFAGKFNGSHPTYVISIDIRRSTDLMLKATDPEKFTLFITNLCDALRSVIWKNHGIFDKFTGDGVLAFFPEFFSGTDSGYLAVQTASSCHEIFSSLYRSHRHCFDTVLKDAGLGIGIDFGEPHLVRQWGSLTVVGKPVVYACRLGGSNLGKS